MIRTFYAGLTKSAITAAGQPPEKKKGLSGKFFLRLLISTGIIVFLVAWLSTETITDAITSVSAGTWVLVLSFFVLGHIFSAFKWRLMLGAANVRIGASLSLRAHFAGLFANLCLPSIVGGDFIRAALVIREQKSEMAAIALGSVADRLNDIFALLIIASVASWNIPAIYETGSGDTLKILALVFLLASVAGIATVRFLPNSFIPGFLHKTFDKLAGATDSIFSNPLTALFGLTLSILIQSGFVGLNVILADAMSIEVPFLVWMFAWPMAKLLALAPISLGGIGVREIALAALLAPFGVDAGLAVAQSLSWEIVLILTGICSGIVVAILPSRSTEID